MTADRAFYERYALDYRTDLGVRSAQLDVIRELLDFHGRQGLDAGCGSGLAAVALSALGARRLVAGDLAQGAVVRGRELAREERVQDRTHFHVFDVAHLPFADGAFDFVLCMEVLEHVQGAGDAARELARVLRPGGAALITVPNVLSPAELAHTAKHALTHALGREPVTHVNHFTYWSVAGLLAPLEVERVVGLHFVTPFLPQRLGPLTFLHGLDRVIGRLLPWVAFDLLVLARKPDRPYPEGHRAQSRVRPGGRARKTGGAP